MTAVLTEPPRLVGVSSAGVDELDSNLKRVLAEPEMRVVYATTTFAGVAFTAAFRVEGVNVAAYSVQGLVVLNFERLPRKRLDELEPHVRPVLEEVCLDLARRAGAEIPADWPRTSRFIKSPVRKISPTQAVS